MNPGDVKNRVFATGFRGYDRSEVGKFLEDVSAQLGESEKLRHELSMKVVELETRLKDYQSMEKAIHQTFMQAQETGGKAIENARKEAQLIIQESELKASQILDKSRTELTILKEQLTILRAKKEAIVSRLRMLLNSELDLIRALAADDEAGKEEAAHPAGELSSEKREIEEIIKSLDE